MKFEEERNIFIEKLTSQFKEDYEILRNEMFQFCMENQKNVSDRKQRELDYEKDMFELEKQRLEDELKKLSVEKIRIENEKKDLEVKLNSSKKKKKKKYFIKKKKNDKCDQLIFDKISTDEQKNDINMSESIEELYDDEGKKVYGRPKVKKTVTPISKLIPSCLRSNSKFSIKKKEKERYI